MSKKRVLLADSSYTIRRIVELSFSEEADIELITFESGTPLRDKLIELTPHVVLVDIRLPEFNGYQVCKFVNENETLADTRVFLLKGGFEPVNEELLKELKYQGIITKPFDSNALVAAVKEVLEPADSPPPVEAENISDSFPEDLPEISGFDDEPDEGISFSDVSEEVATDPPSIPKKKSDTEDFMRDDVMPSEEITQGAQPERDDSLTPDSAEDMVNPFQEDSRESDIDELLEREIERERQSRRGETDMGTRQAEAFRFETPQPPEPPSLEITAPEDQAPDIPEPTTPPPDMPAVSEPVQESSTQDTLSEDELAQAFAEAPEPRQRDDIFAPPTTEASEETPPPIPEPESEVETEPAPPLEVEHTFHPAQEEPVAPVGEDTDAEKILKSLENMEDEPAAPPVAQPLQHREVTPEELQLEEPPPIPAIENELQVESKPEEIDPQQLVHRMEDKLSVAVKEILWEVVPPLAEKIIKEEIHRLESELESSEP